MQKCFGRFIGQKVACKIDQSQATKMVAVVSWLVLVTTAISPICIHVCVKHETHNMGTLKFAKILAKMAYFHDLDNEITTEGAICANISRDTFLFIFSWQVFFKTHFLSGGAKYST